LKELELNDLEDVNKLFEEEIDFNLKQLIMFFICKEKKYSNRRIIINKEQQKSVITFYSGRIGLISKPLIFYLSYIIELVKVTPFFSFDMLKNLLNERNTPPLSIIFRYDNFLENSLLKVSNQHDAFIGLLHYYDIINKEGITDESINKQMVILYNHLCYRYCINNKIPVYETYKLKQYNGPPMKIKTSRDTPYSLTRANLWSMISNKTKKTIQGGSNKKKLLSDCTVKELRLKMKKKKLTCSKDGKKLTKSQMIQKLRR
jgi:hypothetical protein